MHLWLFLGSWVFALSWRFCCPFPLLSLAVPPLFLLSTSIVIVFMGWQGKMWLMTVGLGGYLLALGFGLYALILFALSLEDLKRSIAKIDALPSGERQFHDRTYCWRVLDHPFPFAGLVGCWRAQLVVSQGLLDLLDAEHLEAVLLHEEAHRYFRDPVWFWALAYLKRLTAWLPWTEIRWHGLLLQRELRADRWAAQYIDGLVIAESLVQVVQTGNFLTLSESMGFYPNPGERFEARIEALLTPPIEPFVPAWMVLVGMVIPFIPLLYLPFHH